MLWISKAALAAAVAAMCMLLVGIGVHAADWTPPVIHDCPDHIEVDAAPGARDAQVWWTEPTATDAESGIASFTCTHTNGERFPLGITLVTYVATDGVGNVAYCSFLVIVRETLDLVAPLETGRYLDRVSDQASPDIGELPVVATYVVGEPIEGSCMVINWRDRPFCYDTITMTLHSVVIGNDYDVRELLASQSLSCDPETLTYSFTIETAELEPGYYDIRLGIPSMDHEWLRVEILPSSGAPGTPAADYVLLQEMFEDGEADGWYLDDGWSVHQEANGNHVLYGEGLWQWAIPDIGFDDTDHPWTDYTVSFRMKLISGGMQVECRLTFEGGRTRYMVGFREDDTWFGKEYPNDTYNDVCDVAPPAPLNIGEWHDVVITLAGARVTVFVDGVVWFDRTDLSDPLLRGGIGFETIVHPPGSGEGGSHVYVDDVEVRGGAE